ncbi:MAG: hypothetical protein QUS12_05010 [Methanosarcina sp.]|jgi:hypothetical protein|nr:hypothetical protein [Methanosarcina sp.]
MFFIRLKDSKEVQKSLISDREVNVQYIEKVIRVYEAIDQFYRRYPCPTRRENDLAESNRKMIREWQSNLEVARKRLAQAEREYNNKYGESRGGIDGNLAIKWSEEQ